MIDIPGAVQHNDLRSLAEQAGAQFHRAGSEWRSRCPLHGGDNNDAFAIYHKDGKEYWHCFTGPCGGGDVLDFVMRWRGFTDFMDAYHYLEGDVRHAPEVVAQHAAEQAARAIAEMEAQIQKAQSVLDELRRAQRWLAYHQNMLERPDAREMWRQRGLPDDWQDFWKLGYCDAFTVGTDQGPWVTPTLTIPVFGAGADWPVMNIRHRLLKPPKPNDKYRPDRPGLSSVPYIANPFLGWDTDPILVVEGEIKSMVTFRTVWDKGQTMQVIGIPGKTQFRSIAAQLMGHDVYICFDPDADQQAIEAARAVGGKVIYLPIKIDDAILSGNLDQRSLQFRLKTARKVS